MQRSGDEPQSQAWPPASAAGRTIIVRVRRSSYVWLKKNGDDRITLAPPPLDRPGVPAGCPQWNKEAPPPEITVGLAAVDETSRSWVPVHRIERRTVRGRPRRERPSMSRDLTGTSLGNRTRLRAPGNKISELDRRR